MTLRLVQLAAENERFVAVLEQGRWAVRLREPATTYELAMAAMREGLSLQDAVDARRSNERLDLSALISGTGDERAALVAADRPS